MGNWICNTRAHNSSNHSSEQVSVSGADRWSKRGLVSVQSGVIVNSHGKRHCYTGTQVGCVQLKTQSDICKEHVGKEIVRV